MATYTTAYSGHGSEKRPPGSRLAVGGGLFFVWLAWALAAAFWAATLTTAFGILGALGAADGPEAGSVDAGGVGWLLMDVVGGIVVLGLAMAFAAWRSATRDKRKDVATEASTHALYDGVERAGGDDDVGLSPRARTETGRQSYRPA